MPEYFVIRSSTDQNQKKWILNEIKAGRLRQGWYAHRGTNLVDNRGELIAEAVWIRNFQKVVRKFIHRPKTKEDKYRRTLGFAQEKYRDLRRMLDIPEGARVIVPKLDPNGGEDGFVIARAAKARPTLGPTKGCYFFDLKTKTPHDDYRHVVVVDRESVRVIPADYSKRSEQIYADLGSGRRHPVIHSKDEDFNHAVELVFAASSPPPDDFKPQPVSAAEEKQDRERVIGEIERRRGQPKFRQRLLDAYGRRCAISGCNAEAALEAAHIRTYKGADDNDVRNGLLLRADLHTLFDLGLIKIRTKDWTVLIAPELKGTSYRSLHGKPLRNLPANEEQWPRKVSTIISGRVSTQA